MAERSNLGSSAANPLNRRFKMFVISRRSIALLDSVKQPAACAATIVAAFRYLAEVISASSADLVTSGNRTLPICLVLENHKVGSRKAADVVVDIEPMTWQQISDLLAKAEALLAPPSRKARRVKPTASKAGGWSFEPHAVRL
jgi:hypothetical protein